MGQGGNIKEDKEEEEQGREQDECGKQVKRMFCSAGTKLWPWPTSRNYNSLDMFCRFGFPQSIQNFSGDALFELRQSTTNNLYSTML